MTPTTLLHRCVTTARATLLVTALALGATACGDDSDTASTNSVTSDGGYVPGYKGGLPGFGSVLGSQSATYEYVIPPGAGDALDAGTPLSILPGELTATIGQTIMIVNNDRRGHNVGPWFVGANETVRQEFTSEGKYEGLCTVHPSGAFVLNVIG